VFRFVTLGFNGASVADLLRAGVAFDAAGVVITPAVSLAFILIFGAGFFALCVSRFQSADFSVVKVARRHGH
jgi:ABC-2 type transport system permease protein